MQSGGRSGHRDPAPSIVASVAEAASEPMIVLAADCRIRHANSAAERLLRAPAARLRGVDADRLIAGLRELIPPAGDPLPRPVDSDEPGWEGPPPQLRIPGDEAIPVGIRVSAVIAEGELFACVSIRAGRDRTAASRSRVEAAIARLAVGGVGGVVVIDVDNFELVNQSLGRAAGDRALADLDLALHAATQEGEVAARLEADRFALVSPAGGPQLADRANEILDAIRNRRIAVAGTTIRLTASAGVCALDGSLLSPEQLLLAAEEAAGSAKRQGGDRHVTQEEPGPRRARLGLDWNDKIRTGIEDGGLTPHFQPILELGTNRITHFELLARLREPGGTLIQPGDFIPVAERLGMIGAIDRWAIRTAIRTLARWSSNPGGPRIAVNASGRSVGAAGLLDCLHGELRVGRVDGSKLIIELTETAAIGSIEAAIEFADDLRRLGVGFALDDFGTGFGTFLYLKHLPLDQVKIDGEFIREIGGSIPDQTFVRSLVEVAHGLGVETVAEFVADRSALEWVRRLGIDYAQGFLIGRPQPLLNGTAAVGET